jgi:hypothetical protein
MLQVLESDDESEEDEGQKQQGKQQAKPASGVLHIDLTSDTEDEEYIEGIESAQCEVRPAGGRLGLLPVALCRATGLPDGKSTQEAAIQGPA